MKVKLAERVKRVPKYAFVYIEDLIKEQENKGVDLIRLGVGIPDVPTPQFILDVLAKETQKQKHHRYTLNSSGGEPFFRESVANWMQNRFGVSLEEENVTNLIGSKEGLGVIAKTLVDPGDFVLVPDPGYPVYAKGGAILNEGVPYYMNLEEENGYLPLFDSIPTEIVKKAKLMYLNYPNNPTTAIASNEFLKESLNFAEDNGIVIAFDNAYSEITFDGYMAPSLLQFDGGMDHVEMNSFSKTFSMGGDRIGFAVGNQDVIGGMVKVKSQVDMASPTYIQAAAAAALDSYESSQRPPEIEEIVDTYRKRRDVAVKGLNEIGYKVENPKATFYLWFDCGMNSVDFTKEMIRKGVVVTHGLAFGDYATNYIRLSLIQPESIIEEAIGRMSL